ncbi:uridine kinase [Demequina sp. B12]|uniref:uridine kinase family protein n=1 Tax=Demequina sp. B12 TaxID=2992757 RepID=UPI00237C4AEB|nr:AAA family ATPase [Demequina sp. B12]MDE0573254.1 uridine kinase [Demequina sp. B12]
MRHDPGNTGLQSIIAQAQGRTAQAGTTRVILIDGPAGSGKTTLARRLGAALGGPSSAGPGTYDPANPVPAAADVQVIHTDDMYEGWTGLGALDHVLVDQVLRPLSRGEEAGFAMWDWGLSRRTHRIAVHARPWLVVDGVGSASTAAREFASVVVWIEAPTDVRLARGLERDGEAVKQEWLAWQAEERPFLAAQGLPAAADVVLDGMRVIPD